MAFRLPPEVVQIERLAAELTKLFQEPANLHLHILNHDDEVPWQCDLETHEIPVEWWEKEVYWAIQYAEGVEAPERIDFGELDEYDEPLKTELSEFAPSYCKTGSNPGSI